MTDEESEESDTCRARADLDLDHVDAVLFDLDGVLTDTCWVQILDALIDLRFLGKEAVRWHQR